MPSLRLASNFLRNRNSNVDSIEVLMNEVRNLQRDQREGRVDREEFNRVKDAIIARLDRLRERLDRYSRYRRGLPSSDNSSYSGGRASDRRSRSDSERLPLLSGSSSRHSHSRDAGSRGDGSRHGGGSRSSGRSHFGGSGYVYDHDRRYRKETRDNRVHFMVLNHRLRI
ncbi:hypothetical protein P280DRAFT_475527 [Massarina eburnea CBS 473.64]|uniref:Uncharacterized protein n=1 Tax=Massarina eburnea CBS 473.64 TaxID=1395130 RepID=A0A6A6SGK8_9PLEO|nr:hypothetical protein P280DRAFT_475527 [Massarina eburnea CBS 473.64]